MEFVSKLKEYRLDKGLSRAALSLLTFKCGWGSVSEATIQRVEEEPDIMPSSLSIKNAYSLAAALETEVCELFPYLEAPAPPLGGEE